MEFLFRKDSYKFIVAFMAVCLLSLSSAYAADEKLYKPFFLAKMPAGDFKAAADATKQSLQKAGFKVVGDYSPYEGTRIFSVTNDVLLSIISKQKNAAYAAVQRVSVVNNKGKIQVAYTNPEYMAYAYRMKNNLKPVQSALIAALGKEKEFGAEGLTEEKLREYNYAWGMEYYDDYLELADYSTHAKAVAAVEKGLKNNKIGASKVYRVDIPGTDSVLFGVGLKSPNMFNKYQDDGYIMNIIDFKDIKSAAHLPYEILVTGKNVRALHSRFRIAVNFPDLSMAGENSFMNIMGAPGGIKKALTKVAGGEVNDF